MIKAVKTLVIVKIATWLTVCTFSIANGQSPVNITLGKPYAVIDAEYKDYFINNDKIVAIKYNHKKGIYLQHFDAKTLAFKGMKLYTDIAKGTSFERAIQVKDGLFVLYSGWENDEEQLFAREVDFATGQFKGAAKKIFSIKEKFTGALVKKGMFSLEKVNKYRFLLSNDSSKLLVTYTIQPEKRNDSKNFEVVGVHVLNERMEVVWNKKLTMPYTEKKMDILDYTLNSTGDAFIVAKVYKDNSTNDKKRGDDDANYGLEILKYSQPDGKLTSTKIGLADKFIHTIWLYERPNGNGSLIGAGYYNNTSESLNADGVILCNIGGDLKISEIKTYPIPLAVLNQNASRSQQRKNARKEADGESELKDIRPRYISLQQDGSLVLSGEQYKMTVTYSSTGQRGGSTTTVRYYYNDILVTKIGADGSLQWMNKLPKYQMGYNGTGSLSFSQFSTPQNEQFLFLDNIKNKTLTDNDVPDRYIDGQGGYVTRYIIDDKTGAVSKEYMLNTKDVKGFEIYQFSINRIIPYGINSFIIESYKKGKEDILIKVEM